MATKTSDISSIILKFKENQQPPQKLNRERIRVLKDLTKRSNFKPLGNNNGPYSIDLSIQENKLVFDIADSKNDILPILVLSLSPYRRIIKDYFMMIDSYEVMRGQGTQSKLETIDMARRGIHNEAAELMIERLADKIEMNLDTARGLFTLICVLHLGSLKSGQI